MTGWQEVFKKELEKLELEELEKKIQQKENEIKRHDKRTRNGKMATIFDKAELLVMREVWESWQIPQF